MDIAFVSNPRAAGGISTASTAWGRLMRFGSLEPCCGFDLIVTD